MNKFRGYLYRHGLLHVSHSKSEHIADYIAYGSLLILSILFLTAIVDEAIFHGVFKPYFAIIGKIALGGFGCVLVILATNKII